MNKRGFTLLELLMVVIIIAILASVALPQYIRATEKARGAEALQLLGAIRSSQNRYRAQSPSNVFAATIGDLDFELPATLRFWNSPPGLTNTKASFSRLAGQYSAQVLGMFHDNGEVCGTFAPMGTLVSC